MVVLHQKQRLPHPELMEEKVADLQLKSLNQKGDSMAKGKADLKRKSVTKGIYKENNSYYAYLYVRGRRVGPKKFQALLIAKKWRNKKLVEKDENENMSTSVRIRTVTFDSLVKDRLDETKGNKSSLGEQGMMRWWKKRFENCLVRDISHQHVSRALVDLIEAGKTPATRNRYLTSLKATFNLAIENGKIERDPSAKVKRVKENNQTFRWLKPSEENQLMEVIPLRRDKLLVKISLHTALRLNEQMSLRWSDIDFKTNKITIRETKAGVVQYQPMNKTALEAFRELKEMPTTHISDVFYWINQSTGNPKNKQYPKLQKTWKRYVALAGIDACRWHDLRHSFASRLVIAGESIVDVCKLMRHSSITVTMRYIHLAPNSVQTALSSLDKVYTEPEIFEEMNTKQLLKQPSVNIVNS